MAAAHADWKTSGLIKGIGIPAPSGSYEVGCLHLMHQDLFMRLYYPAQEGSINYQYAKQEYDPKYKKAILDFLDLKLSGLIAGVLGFFMSTYL